MAADVILFYVFAVLAVAASVLVIAQRSTIYSVLLLIASFVALAGLYVLLDAPFLAVIQIIIYAGAIMVLFLFVVMLLNAPYESGAGGGSAPDAPLRLAGDAEPARSGQAGGVETLKGRTGEIRAALKPSAMTGAWKFAAALGLVLIIELVWTLWRSSPAQDAQTAMANSRPAEAISSVRMIGQVLYTDYAFAFEVTSILILVAMVGAVVLAKREI